MNACSERCGWCGRCEDNRTLAPPIREYLFCDTCRGDAVYPISLQGVGIFCCRECATKASEKHADAMNAVRR